MALFWHFNNAAVQPSEIAEQPCKTSLLLRYLVCFEVNTMVVIYYLYSIMELSLHNRKN